MTLVSTHASRRSKEEYDQLSSYEKSSEEESKFKQLEESEEQKSSEDSL